MLNQNIRLIVFLASLFLWALLEFIVPKRPLRFTRRSRWPVNIGVTVVNTLLIQLLLFVFPMEAAIYAQERGIGLFHLIHFPFFVEAVLGFLAMDLAIYWQHRIFHRVFFLWRLHSPHHSDTDLDVTTALRFHPLEILISSWYKTALVFFLGLSLETVLIFEIFLNAGAMFNHSNIRIPRGLDHLLRSCIVTPDMHSIHHSRKLRELNSNYGFFLSFWDYLFRSYTAYPAAGEQGLNIGLPGWNTAATHRLRRVLLMPFVKGGRDV